MNTPAPMTDHSAPDRSNLDRSNLDRSNLDRSNLDRSSPDRSNPYRPGQPVDHLDPQVGALLKTDAAGLVAAVIQDLYSGQVLMVGWMDETALHATLTTGRTTFYSRSRQAYWVKGETSGHRQWVHEVRLDCDGDTLLITVVQEGPACHTGARSCFDDRVLLAAKTPRASAPVEGSP